MRFVGRSALVLIGRRFARLGLFILSLWLPHRVAEAAETVAEGEIAAVGIGDQMGPVQIEAPALVQILRVHVGGHHLRDKHIVGAEL